MLELKNVSFSYEKDRGKNDGKDRIKDGGEGRGRGKDILTDISFHIARGEKAGLIGANGAGKSTILKLIPGLLFGEGAILVDGMPVEKKNLPQIRKKTGFVLQSSDNQMFMPTVLEDMVFGPMNYGLSREAASAKAEEVLEELHIPELKNRYNHKISGGEKRMAAIATVLSMEPELILMDEPTSALDPYNRRLVIRIMRSLPQTLLITSHDLDMIYDICSRVILVSEGRIVADGPADRILRDRELLEENHLELPLRFQGAEGAGGNRFSL